MKDLIIKVDNFIDMCMESSLLQWIMVVFASLAFGIFCFGRTIWLDEALTGLFIRDTPIDIIKTAATDVHPPLYYLIIKVAITLLGEKMWVVKLFSYLPFVLILVVAKIKLPKLFGKKVTFITLALLCVTPCIIRKQAEMRMYTWAMFFVFLFGISFYNGLLNHCKADIWIGIIMGICAAYTHYYAIVAVAAFYIFMYFVEIKNKKNRRNIYLGVLLSIITYFPWLIVFINQTRDISETGWWNRADLSLKHIVMDYIAFPFADGREYLQVFFLLVLILSVFGALKSKDKKIAYGFMLPYFTVVLSGIIITIVFMPVFISRFLIPSVALLLLGMAIGLSKINPKCILIILVIFGFFGMKTYNSQLHYCYDKDSIAKLDQYMEAIDRDDTVFLYDNDADKVIMKYLYPGTKLIQDISADKEEIGNKDVFYLLCDSKVPNNQVLENLSISDYEKQMHINVQYHGFDILKLTNNN